MSTTNDTPPAVQPTIAVIDDDVVALATASRLLEQCGFRVVTCERAHARLAFVAEERPDLVLMDVNMPLVPGDELYVLMQGQPALRSIPVVFFSSNDEQTLRSMVRATGALGYISKSDMAFGLGARVSHFLERARSPF